EAHFKGRNLNNLWDCVALFAPDASTEGPFKVDLYERFNADYRQFSWLMDRFLPDARALPYVDRLARLTEIRSYVRAQYLREDAAVNWTEVGAKVKKLIDQRIDAHIRELMKPASILDSDFDEKVASLPHDEARASLMEHAIRAQITERLADNPAFYEKLSERLRRIIEEIRRGVLNAAEACRRMAELRHEVESEADVASQHGLSPVAFAIYELLEPSGEPIAGTGVLKEERAPYRVHFDDQLTAVARQVESALSRHMVVDWQWNLEVQREMRRDVKRELRAADEYTEERLDALANEIVDLARRRSAR
ncbi:MAG: type I restriction enzyme endonuclease domain-containing protein, partial [Dehalococcoidia bacterium]